MGSRTRKPFRLPDGACRMGLRTADLKASVMLLWVLLGIGTLSSLSLAGAGVARIRFKPRPTSTQCSPISTSFDGGVFPPLLPSAAHAREQRPQGEWEGRAREVPDNDYIMYLLPMYSSRSHQSQGSLLACVASWWPLVYPYWMVAAEHSYSPNNAAGGAAARHLHDNLTSDLQDPCTEQVGGTSSKLLPST